MKFKFKKLQGQQTKFKFKKFKMMNNNSRRALMMIK